MTTIIDLGIPKPALMYWSAKMAAQYAVENLDVLGQMVERGDRDLAVDAVKNAHRRTASRAALRGTHVHRAIEAYITGRPYPGVPEDAEPVYRGFLAFLEEHRPTFEATEFKVFSDERRYAGTADAIATLPRLAEGPYPHLAEGPVLIDWKAKPAVYAETALQLAAYRHAELIQVQGGQERPMPQTAGAVVVRLDEYDYEVLPVDSGDEVFRAFLYAREVARWQEQTSKGVILAAAPRPEERVDPAAVEVGEQPPVLRPCPACGGEVEEVQDREGKQPRWRCPEPDCTGGKDGHSWASWDANPWRTKAPASKPDDAPKPARRSRAKAKPKPEEEVTA